MEIELSPLGDSAVLARVAERIGREAHGQVRVLAGLLESSPFAGLVEAVPAFTTVAVFYDPLRLRYEEAAAHLQRIAAEAGEAADQAGEAAGEAGRLIEIPVLYGEPEGPDLEWVARRAGLAPDEAARLHASGDYLVHMIGFTPGFPYLGGLPERLAAPRRETPRVAVPPGSVGIAGHQTGIYSIESPGGWRIIGRTPLRMFRPDRTPPCRLRAGDAVRFRAIDREEYKAAIRASNEAAIRAPDEWTDP